MNDVAINFVLILMYIMKLEGKKHKIGLKESGRDGGRREIVWIVERQFPRNDRFTASKKFSSLEIKSQVY